jgi:hypothetical protein
VTKEAEGLVEGYRATGRRGPELGLERHRRENQDGSENAADQLAQTSSQERSAGKVTERTAGAGPSAQWRGS